MGLQIDFGYVFRPTNPIFWLPLDAGEIEYFFYSAGSITSQTYDLQGNPLDAMKTLVSGVGPYDANFVTELENGDCLLSYREYFDKGGKYSFVTHYNIYDPAWNLVDSESAQYDGSSAAVGIKGVYNLADGERIEFFRALDENISPHFYFNVFGDDGDRVTKSYEIQPDDGLTVKDADFLALQDGGFAAAVITKKGNVPDKYGMFRWDTELQFFDSNGQKLDEKTFLPNTLADGHQIQAFAQSSSGDIVLITRNEHYAVPEKQQQFVFDASGDLISQCHIPIVGKPRSHFDVADTQVYPLPDGGWITAWAEGLQGWQILLGGNGLVDGYYFQRFDAGGKRVGDLTTIAVDPTGWFATILPELKITSLNSGDLLMTWYADDPDNAFGLLPMQRVLGANGQFLTKAAAISTVDYRSAIVDIDALDDGGWRVDFADGTFKSFHLNDVDTAPVAYKSGLGMLENSHPWFILRDFIYSDVDGDEAKRIIITSLPDKGTLTFRGKLVHAGISIPVDRLDKLHFRPDHNGTGDDYAHFGYKVVVDGSRAVSNEATFHLKVIPVNDAPRSADFNISLPSERARTGSADRDHSPSHLGNDVHINGSGHDVFILDDRSGRDIVRDFSHHDVMHLAELHPASCEEFMREHTDERNGSLWIYHGLNHTDSAVVLEHTSLHEVHQEQLMLI